MRQSTISTYLWKMTNETITAPDIRIEVAYQQNQSFEQKLLAGA